MLIGSNTLKIVAIILPTLIVTQVGCIGPSGTEPVRVTSTSEWVAISKPGAAHQLLDPFAGEWDLKISHYSKPDVAPSVSRGTSKVSWILGDRFLQEDLTGEIDGEKFIGVGLMGYDNSKRKFTTVWVDNMNTAIADSEGDYSTEQHLFTFTSKIWDPLVGRERQSKSTVRLVSEDKYIFTSFDKAAYGEDVRVFEIEYLKKQAR